METYIVKPYGCCQGVKSAIKLVEMVKANHPHDKIYILGMLVHNDEVVQHLTTLGVISLYSKDKTLEELLLQIEKGVVIFTAHGHSKKLEEIAINKKLFFYDATCPFVRTNHNLIEKALKDNREVIFIGKKNHPETEACLSYGKGIILYDTNLGMDYQKVTSSNPIVLTQTTLSILELKEIYNDIKNHYPNAQIMHEVCNSTRIRQTSLLDGPKDSDLVVIVGSNTSSNSNKLREIAEVTYLNAKILQIDTLEQLKEYDLKAHKKAVIAAGASVFNATVEKIISYIQSI